MTTAEQDVTEASPSDVDASPRRIGHRVPRPRLPVLVLVAALAFFFGPAAAYLVGVRASQIDNRSLTKFPSADQGWKALPQLGNWATDHLPGRKEAVDANGSLDRTVFREEPKYGSDLTGSVSYPRVIEGKDGWLYYGADVSGRCKPAASVVQIMASMRQLAQAVTSSGRRFVMVVAPDKSTIYPQHLPSQFAGKRCLAARNDAFWPALRATPGIGSVDLKAALENEAGRTGVLTYRLHDTHFSPFGGAVYAGALATALDPRLSANTTVPVGPMVDRLGDLSTFIGKPVKDHVPSYPVTRDGVTLTPGSDPTLRYTLTVMHNTSTKAPLYQDRTILLGDSFSQSARSQLIPYFADLTMIHSEMSTKEPQVIANDLLDRGTVVYEIVERSASTGLAGLLSPTSIKTIRDTLAAHPYRR